MFFDDFEVVHTKGPVVQSEEYYPFGLTFSFYQRESGISNLFQYNGKERQDELDLNWMDYGARMYDPSLGRFTTIDPLAEQMRRVSPYAYAFNNPVVFRDPDGMKPKSSSWSFEPGEEQPEEPGADGLTNSQWIEASRPGADPNLYDDYRKQNREKEDENMRKAASFEVGELVNLGMEDDEQQKDQEGNNQNKDPKNSKQDPNNSKYPPGFNSEEEFQKFYRLETVYPSGSQQYVRKDGSSHRIYREPNGEWHDEGNLMGENLQRSFDRGIAEPLKKALDNAKYWFHIYGRRGVPR